MEAVALEGGFADAPVAAAKAFRAVLNAMARPGRIERICGARPPAGLSAAAGTVLLTLADGTTPVHLAGGADRVEVRDWLTFHTGAPIVGRGEAVFAVGEWAALLPLEGYRTGTAEYPDRSATLIVEMDRLEAAGARLTGPGIETEARLNLPEVAGYQANGELFPLGLDFCFTSGEMVAALPRTTKVEAG